MVLPGAGRDAVLAADVAAAAPGELLAEILEKRAAAALAPFDVAAHRRRALAEPEVFRSPQHPAFGGCAIPPRPPRLLVVAFQRPRRPPVEHATHVGLVDPPPACRRTPDHPPAIVEARAPDPTPH